MVGRDATWWRSAVFYECYIRSFADSDGDGVGDLRGITSRLDYLASLGIDALWITPFFASPMVDHGYDVSDYRAVDPLFGTLKDVDDLVEAAHERDIRVVLDIVLNHTSDRHHWFTEALASGPGSRARARYFFRDGRGPDGALPPNNWTSVFGGSAWTRVADGQWYLHLFAAEQPDLNWDDDDVVTDMAATLRFWLDRGVDGFRFDVAHGMAKPEGLPDMAVDGGGLLSDHAADPRFNQPGVHAFHRRIRAELDAHQVRTGRHVMSVGEVWERDEERLSHFIRPDELHSVFNFRLLQASWDAQELRTAIDSTLRAAALVDASPTWVLSNHDKSRHASRYGGGELGQLRARAAVLLELALPGAPYIYNGDELGLEDVPVPEASIADPQWHRSGGAQPTRDVCRIPLPWSSAGSTFGFSDSDADVRPWLPTPPGWGELSVASQTLDPTSMLSLYREAISIRRLEPAFSDTRLFWEPSPPDVLQFRRSSSSRRDVICVVNLGDGPIDLPEGDVLLRSDNDSQGSVRPDEAVWVAAVSRE